MLAVGLDLSLSATGVATASGYLHTLRSLPDDGTIVGRVQRIADLADRIVDCVADAVTLAVIEGPAYASQAQDERCCRADARLRGCRARPVARIRLPAPRGTYPHGRRRQGCRRRRLAELGVES